MWRELTSVLLAVTIDLTVIVVAGMCYYGLELAICLSATNNVLAMSRAFVGTLVQL